MSNKKLYLSLFGGVLVVALLCVALFSTTAKTQVQSTTTQSIVTTAVQAMGSSSDKARIADLEAQIKVGKDTEAANEELGQYVINLIYKNPETAKSMSPAGMRVLVRNVVRDTSEVISDPFVRRMFLSAVQFESGYIRSAQSPTGPKGLSQTTKSTFHSALKTCGVPDVKDSDVWDVDLSIYAGACYFNWLYNSYYTGYYVDSKGKTTTRPFCPDNDKEPWAKKLCASQMASVAYNQGENSKAIKSFTKNGTLEELEPAVYNGKIINNYVTTPDAQMPGVPSFHELPKPALQVTADSKGK